MRLCLFILTESRDYSVSNWLTARYREVRGNAVWDAVKFGLKLAGEAGLVTVLMRVLNSARDIPQDWVVTIGIFGGSFLLLLLGYFLLRRRSSLPENDAQARSFTPTETDSSKVHENCERQINNLESQVHRLRERDQTWGVQVSARDGEIQQLKTKLSGYKWLDEIATEQAQTIHRFVSMSECRFGRFELFQRNDPYIEFILDIWNRSVYDVSIPEPSGPIDFNGRELMGTPQWKESKRSITWSNQGWFTLRQNLSSEDVVHIMNGSAHFSFHLLNLRVEGAGIADNVIPQPLSLSGLIPNNKPILDTYPKLQIQVSQLKAAFIVNLQQGKSAEDALISMHVAVENHRTFPTIVEDIHFRIVIKGSGYITDAERGKIWESMHINEEGKLQNNEIELDNLTNRLPLRVLRAEMSGCLQFIFKTIGAEIFNNEVFYELILTDRSGERHLATGLLNKLDGN
jgi:hypothetical protein